MAKRKFYPLYDPSDEESVRPILDKLEEKGYERSSGKEPGGHDVIFFFMSKNLKEGSSIPNNFIKYNKSFKFVPVNLDGSPLLSGIQGSIKASNALFAEKYLTDELADRLGESLRSGIGIPKWFRNTLIAASAVLLVAVFGVIIYRVISNKNTGGEDVTASIEKPEKVFNPVIPNEIPSEDVTKIREVVFVGDTYKWYTIDDDETYKEKDFRRSYDAFSYRYWTDDGAKWISKEDGHEYPITQYDDISWITLLPNLQSLTLCAVDVEIPNLSELKNLNNVTCCDNNIGSLEWLRGSSIEHIEYHGSDVVDFSPLTDCKKLTDARFDLVFSRSVDFSEFHPWKLRSINIGNGHELNSVDLSGLNKCVYLEEAFIEHMPVSADFSLNKCTYLKKLELKQVPINSLEAISKCVSLEDIYLEEMNIGSLNGIENFKKLRYLRLNNVRLSDISAVENCKELETFRLDGNENEGLRNLASLGELPKLKDISVQASGITNLNFLRDIQQKGDLHLDFSGWNITDFSGLEAIDSFRLLNVSKVDLSEDIMPYLQDTPIYDLEMYECTGYDLSQFGNVTNSLFICDGNITSLEGIDTQAASLELIDCQYLTSLEGIQYLEKFGEEKGTLRVEGCPRLTDWTALDGMRLDRMIFVGTYSLPDFGKTNARFFTFEHVMEEALPDLSVLDGLDKEQRYNFNLVGQENITDLIPLFNLRGGRLEVPPMLGDQAQELVMENIFTFYQISYPNSEWHPNNAPIVLSSLDELEVLPKTVLARVERLYMAGDVIYDPDKYWIEEDWATNPVSLYIIANNSEDGERVAVENGTRLTDLSMLENLTGLKELSLRCVPVKSLEGIQNLESLENLFIEFCPELTDASAAFTLQNLKRLSLRCTSVTSVEGLKYLYDLEALNVEGLELEDLSQFDGLSEDLLLSIDLPMIESDELKNVPLPVLNNIRNLIIAGKYAVSRNHRWVEKRWDEETETDTYFISDNWTGEKIPLTEEGSLTDLKDLPQMNRLDYLIVCMEPLKTLDGIDRFKELSDFEVQNCPKLTDISQIFTFEDLSTLRLDEVGISSISGIENLKKLTWLSLRAEKVNDYSPLGKVDYSYCMEPDEGGWVPHFGLDFYDHFRQYTEETYDFISKIPYFDYLNLGEGDYKLWADRIKNTPIRRIDMFNCGFDNDGFKDFIEAHPELEEIDIRWNDDLTDISPVLSLENLRRVVVSDNMRQAIRSVGNNHDFELEIED
ncbi:MAG: hypothetical protein K6A97_03675 [Lachnospiraceae bacterium]|nr:hypothetical protein [Lachnospiraceae bacterium]